MALQEAGVGFLFLIPLLCLDLPAYLTWEGDCRCGKKRELQVSLLHSKEINGIPFVWEIAAETWGMGNDVGGNGNGKSLQACKQPMGIKVLRAGSC